MPVPDGDLDRAALDDVAAAFHAEHRGLYGYDFAGDPTQQVEWVNLRVSGIGPITRPEIRRVSGGSRRSQSDLLTGGGRRPAPVSKPPVTRPVCFDADDGYVETAVLLARGPRSRDDASTGPAIIEEYGSTVPLHPGFAATVDDFGNLRGPAYAGGPMSRRVPTQFPYGPLTADAGASADPVLVEIVQGSLASVEAEVETAIARTSRSPMIRDAHDFRAGIHDRLLRKLTGRSYSALVHPVARDFPVGGDARRATCSSTTTSTAPRAASGTCPTSA